MFYRKQPAPVIKLQRTAFYAVMLILILPVMGARLCIGQQRQGHYQIVRKLLELGAELDADSYDGMFVVTRCGSRSTDISDRALDGS